MGAPKAPCHHRYSRTGRRRRPSTRAYGSHRPRALGFARAPAILAAWRHDAQVVDRWNRLGSHRRVLPPMNLETKHRLGGHHSAQVTIHSLDFQPLLERANNVTALEEIFNDAAAALQAAGSSLLAVASFTGHRYVGRLNKRSVPFVDLIESLAAHMRSVERAPVAVWATSIALADAALLARLTDAMGAPLILPSGDERAMLDRIVFSEAGGSARDALLAREPAGSAGASQSPWRTLPAARHHRFLAGPLGARG